MIWHYYHDAVKEGDGDRVMLIWKLLLLIYHVTNRRNYAKEAAVLLFQKDAFFSERKVAQLKWSHFVNVNGFAGHNIPSDLHMEHLNRRLKTMLKHSRSNVIKPNTVVRAAKSIGFVNHVCTTFEQECGVKNPYNQHKSTSFEKDLKRILICLQEIGVFTEHTSRRYASFSTRKGIINSCSKESIESWVVTNIFPKLIFL